MLTMTDLFCGAGGSSTGATMVPDVEVTMAANHWQLAIETHNTNHPNTDHDCADISQVDPRRYPNTDILWGSPECTNHSQAKGKKRSARTVDSDGNSLPEEAEERSRATMWDIVRFAEHHHYQAVVVENVVEARQWRPFTAWLAAMHSLGYQHQLVFLNSAHAHRAGAPAPQSRDRMYVVFHREGNPAPDVAAWTSPTGACECGRTGPLIQSWKKPGEPWGRYRSQYVYRCPCGQKVDPFVLPAAAAIDWSLAGQRIGDRSRPLADNTKARIEAGLRKFGGRPNLIPKIGAADMEQLLRSMGVSRSISETDTRSVMPAGGFVMRNNGSKGDGREMSTLLGEPLRTLTTVGSQSLITWDAHIAYNRTALLRPITEPLQTLMTRDSTSLVKTAPTVEDCLFRMLEPHEVARGMAFPEDYTILGNKRERVKQAGNAVTPPAARDLIAAVAESLGAQIARPEVAA
jgi:DNA (cytosine-5)-methyltransferase 1